MTSNLTDKQEMFCREYLIDLNATQAAIRAGYSEKTARSIGQENLTKPDIQDFITALKKKREEKIDISAERVLNELGRLAFLDIRKAFDDEGRLKSVHDIDDDTVAAISGIEVEELWEGRGEDREHIGRLHKIKLSDKIGALEKLGRYHKLFTDKTEHSGKLQLNGLSQILQEIDGNSADLPSGKG